MPKIGAVTIAILTVSGFVFFYLYYVIEDLLNIDKTDQNAARVDDQVAGIQTASRTEKAIVTLPGMIVVSTYYLCSWQMVKVSCVLFFFAC